MGIRPGLPTMTNRDILFCLACLLAAWLIWTASYEAIELSITGSSIGLGNQSHVVVGGHMNGSVNMNNNETIWNITIIEEMNG